MQNAATLHRTSSLVRVAAVVIALCGALSAQAGIKSEKFLSAILAQTPAAQIVAQGRQAVEAEKAAAQIPGAEMFWGVGASMEPLYASNTAVIVAPVKFSELKKGMTVVYVNSLGRMVAHSLKSDMPKGWIAQGVNNDYEDNDLVTKKNLVGVIVKAFAASDSVFRLEVTKLLASKSKPVLVASRT
ncbi:MAG TPA: hypothetical protein VHO24_05665 [Opitutaceae bacterium]|nr:hypothetical protein [Opitutaceae bacterium]